MQNWLYSTSYFYLCSAYLVFCLLERTSICLLMKYTELQVIVNYIVRDFLETGTFRIVLEVLIGLFLLWYVQLEVTQMIKEKLSYFKSCNSLFILRDLFSLELARYQLLHLNNSSIWTSFQEVILSVVLLRNNNHSPLPQSRYIPSLTL